MENPNIKEDGILGPIIRAQVRDTLKVSTTNMEPWKKLNSERQCINMSIIIFDSNATSVFM